MTPRVSHIFETPLFFHFIHLWNLWSEENIPHCIQSYFRIQRTTKNKQIAFLVWNIDSIQKNLYLDCWIPRLVSIIQIKTYSTCTKQVAVAVTTHIVPFRSSLRYHATSNQHNDHENQGVNEILNNSEICKLHFSIFIFNWFLD